MDREVIINKILRDLKSFDLIKEDDSGHIKKHLEFLYGAAWWEGRRSGIGGHRKRQVELYVYDIFKDSFNSEREASNITKESESTIKRALRSGEATSKGHVWKYVETKSGS
jgi:hypothetical protein